MENETSLKPQKSMGRTFAALDFLLNIEMQNEKRIRELGLSAARRSIEVRHRDGDSDDDDENNYGDDWVDREVFAQKLEEGLDDLAFGTAPGRKLYGKEAPTVQIPPHLRFKLSRISDQSALIYNWEGGTLHKMSNARRGGIGGGLSQDGSTTSEDHSSRGLVSSGGDKKKGGDDDDTKKGRKGRAAPPRLFMSRSRGYPNAISSVIAYAPEREKAKLEQERLRNEGRQAFILPSRDWRGFSYHNLLNSSKEKVNNQVWYERGYSHDPDFLDDPAMIHGAAKYLQNGKKDAKIGPVLSSVILFVNPQELKENLNEQFRGKHQELPPSLTLSKIRKMKKDMLLICLALDMEISTAANACIYLERLCLKGVVTKANRRLSMAACLILSFKYSETTGSSSQGRSKLDALIEYIDHEWLISRAQVLDAEFGAFVQLEFALHTPYVHVMVMSARLLKLIHRSLKSYLGDEMYKEYNQTVHLFEAGRSVRDHQKEVEKRELEREIAAKIAIEVEVELEREMEKEAEKERERSARKKERNQKKKEEEKEEQLKKEAAVGSPVLATLQ